MASSQYDKSFRLDGRIALITGAAQGIGKAISVLFAEKGADLILVDLNEEELNKAAKEITRMGRKAVPMAVDLTVKDSCRSVAEESVKACGRVDILVNNAGVALLESAETITEEYWDTTMAINLKVPFLLSQAVGREMIKRKAGNIINIASQAGIIALERHLAYCTSKAAIIEMTKVLALEWGKYGINVNAISPTVVLTELGKKAWAGEVGESFKKSIPIGRFADPEEIAACALFLASDAARMITGSNLVIDGGYTIQ